MSLGIMAIGYALGTPVPLDELAANGITDDPKVRQWGYRRLHRAPEEVGLTDLAVRAGETALRRAGIEAGEVDLVILAITDIAEYLYWDAAAAVTGRLDARHAEAMLLSQACGGGVAAFDIVAGKFAIHPRYRTALVIAANRIAETYWDRVETSTSLSSDGAAAAVLRRDHPSCRWLATEVVTDGRYADFMRMEVGGAAHPFTGTERPVIPALIDRMDTFFDGNGGAALAFVDQIHARNRDVIERACASADVAIGSIERVLYLHDNAGAFADLAKALGVPLDRTNLEIARDHGHFGPADQLLSLERLLATGELVAGDTVALLSMGTGMHWACTLLRI